MRLPRRLLDGHWVHEPVLGTLLIVDARAPRSVLGGVVVDVVATVRELEAVFSVFDPASELARWASLPPDDPAELDGGGIDLGADLTHLLVLSSQWQRRTHGIYNPAVGEVTRRWKTAAEEQVMPTSDELAALAASIAGERYRVERGRTARCGDCTALNFNALAKGLIVDHAAARAWERLAPHGLDRLVVNIGGEIRHLGNGKLRVGVENPHRPYDNEPPLVVVDAANVGVATSGSARRGVRIGEQWISHVIDPRTAGPATGVASATVVAPDTATADAVATLVSVATPEESLPIVAEIETEIDSPIACFIVTHERAQFANEGWVRLSEESASRARR